MKFIEKALFESFHVSTKHLSIYRIIFGAYIIVFSGLPSFSWLGSELSYFFTPPAISIANLFHSFPSRGFFIALSLINILSFFFIFCGFFTKWSSIVFSCSYILGSNFLFSFGKIDHSLLIYITPLFLSYTGWGNHYSIDNWWSNRVIQDNSKAQTEFRSFIIAVFALCIGFTFFTSGIVKLIAGWWKWNEEAIKYYLYNGFYSLNRTQYLSRFFMGIKSHLFWKVLDYMTLLFELGFLASVINIKAFRCFLFAAVIFHCMVLLMLNISFATNFIVYLLFIDWEKFLSPWRHKITRVNSNLVLKVAFALSGVLLFDWVYRLFAAPDFERHYSVLGISINTFHLPDISRILIYSISILGLFYIYYVSSKKNTGNVL